MPTGPGTALEVVQAEAVLEFPVVMLDAPADLGCPAPEDLLDQVLDQVAPDDPEDDIALVAARYNRAGG
ncbi:MULTISPECIES: hypothetical protein [unclassified Streptomyces]|uniref:hypothetical protein n=1 Tax=unclassified Streptomyces TaxID=2593676 RepID=UPI002252EB34|nr:MULTISPECIES: hypothetical protein [unclassified Streptomyces]MCX5052134.1 hypothetical protein [Streptomyces sp. NBC_00474]MCX5063437.1 hypothetical protein [Streptomyces sp. NBC_00452]MCX5251290.1 hypothetical protein [Streptomyces sp. NBC_00201]MCX5294787.1 hypothetical protein [Streptomyces sp. NBC_00183]